MSMHTEGVQFCHYWLQEITQITGTFAAINLYTFLIWVETLSFIPWSFVTFFPLQKCRIFVVVMSSLFVVPLSLTLAISPFHHYSLHLSPHCWEIVEVSPLFCHTMFVHISCATRARLLLNCASTILNNRATVHLAATMKKYFFIVMELGDCALEGNDKGQW